MRASTSTDVYSLREDGSFILGEKVRDKGEPKGSSHFVLHAGATQGVTKGSTYDIHSNLISDLDHLNLSLATVVSEVECFLYTIAHARCRLRYPRLFYCHLQTRAAKKLVCIVTTELGWRRAFLQMYAKCWVWMWRMMRTPLRCIYPSWKTESTLTGMTR